MARKPKAALPELHIEALSTGELVGLVDEFTGQPIPQPNARPRLTSAELRAAAVRQHEQTQLTVLVDAGLGPLVGYKRKPRLVEAVPKGKRKVAEFNGLAVLVDIPKWRRV